VPVGELEAHLNARFGSPDERSLTPYGYLSATWRAGDRILSVEGGPRVDQHLQNKGVQSSMTLELSDEGFDDYLEAAAERCERLADKPGNELSRNEAADLSMGCLEP
jgi:hypothetical protein